MDGTWNDPLPRGRHNLTREEVSASQRSRILKALLEEVAVRGYAATSVAHITSRAGVSRKSFYEQFSDKQDCYFVAYDMAAERLATSVARVARDKGADIGAGGAGGRDPVEPIEYFRTILRAFLEGVAAHPAAARTMLVEIYAVGPEAIRRKLGSTSNVLARFLAPLGYASPDGGLTFEGEAIVGGIHTRLTHLVALGRTDEVPDLCDPFVDWVARHLDCTPAGRVGATAPDPPANSLTGAG